MVSYNSTSISISCIPNIPSRVETNVPVEINWSQKAPGKTISIGMWNWDLDVLFEERKEKNILKMDGLVSRK